MAQPLRGRMKATARNVTEKFTADSSIKGFLNNRLADCSAYVSALKECIDKKCLSEGKLVNTHIVKRGLWRDRFLGNTLVNMYAKCGSLEDARNVFDKMPQRDAFSWTVMIATHAKQGHAEEAWALFCQMQATGVQPNHFTFACVLPLCAKLGFLGCGEIVHGEIVRSGFQSDVFVGCALVDMYTKCGRMEDAHNVFDEMSQRDVVLWNAMIAGCAQNGVADEALSLFYRMKESGIEPDQFTLVSVLAACADLAALEQGKKIHEEIDRLGCQHDVFVGSALIDMYAKCRSVEGARKVFDGMPLRDVVLWNAMMGGYTQNGLVDEAMVLFYEMQRMGTKPNEFTFASVLPACANLAVVQEIHEQIIRSGIQSNIYLENALVDIYAKCGSIENAHDVFLKMPKRNVISWTAMIAGNIQNGYVDEALKLFQAMPERNAVSWNAMIAGYAQNGHIDEALKFFREMPEQNVVSWNTMLSAYAQNGNVDEAMKLFQKMPEPNVVSWNTMVAAYSQNGFVIEAVGLFKNMPERNVVSWKTMIAGYAQNGHDEEALKLFQEMQLAVVKQDSDTFAIVLPACANLGTLEQGEEIHEVTIRHGFQSDTFVGSALVNMYAKCGSIQSAYILFDKLPWRDLVSWNAMITGYAIHGCGKEALQCFEQMQHSNMNPDHVTFVGILCACCHEGLLDEGWHYFHYMKQYYQITPGIKHYGCMVDLLARAGKLGEAQEFIKQMPIKPDATIWGCLLSACGIYTNVELGEQVAKELFDLDPENSTPYVLLSNIYAGAGRWDCIEKMRSLIKYNNLKKRPGWSWIKVKKKVHAFLASDV